MDIRSDHNLLRALVRVYHAQLEDEFKDISGVETTDKFLRKKGPRQVLEQREPPQWSTAAWVGGLRNPYIPPQMIFRCTMLRFKIPSTRESGTSRMTGYLEWIVDADITHSYIQVTDDYIQQRIKERPTETPLFIQLDEHPVVVELFYRGLVYQDYTVENPYMFKHVCAPGDGSALINELPQIHVLDKAFMYAEVYFLAEKLRSAFVRELSLFKLRLHLRFETVLEDFLTLLAAVLRKVEEAKHKKILHLMLSVSLWHYQEIRYKGYERTFLDTIHGNYWLKANFLRLLRLSEVALQEGIDEKRLPKTGEKRKYKDLLDPFHESLLLQERRPVKRSRSEYDQEQPMTPRAEARVNSVNHGSPKADCKTPSRKPYHGIGTNYSNYGASSIYGSTRAATEKSARTTPSHRQRISAAQSAQSSESAWASGLRSTKANQSSMKTLELKRTNNFKSEYSDRILSTPYQATQTHQNPPEDGDDTPGAVDIPTFSPRGTPAPEQVPIPAQVDKSPPRKKQGSLSYQRAQPKPGPEEQLPVSKPAPNPQKRITTHLKPSRKVGRNLSRHASTKPKSKPIPTSHLSFSVAPEQTSVPASSTTPEITPAPLITPTPKLISAPEVALQLEVISQQGIGSLVETSSVLDLPSPQDVVPQPEATPAAEPVIGAASTAQGQSTPQVEAKAPQDTPFRADPPPQADAMSEGEPMTIDESMTIDEPTPQPLPLPAPVTESSSTFDATAYSAENMNFNFSGHGQNQAMPIFTAGGGLSIDSIQDQQMSDSPQDFPAQQSQQHQGYQQVQTQNIFQQPQHVPGQQSQQFQNNQQVQTQNMFNFQQPQQIQAAQQPTWHLPSAPQQQNPQGSVAMSGNGPRKILKPKGRLGKRV